METDAQRDFAKDPLIEERISHWRKQEAGQEDEEYVVLICDAEEELRRLRNREKFLLDKIDLALKALQQWKDVDAVHILEGATK